MFRAILGQAEGIDTLATADEVFSQCRSQIGELKPSAGLIFASGAFDHGLLLKMTREAFPALELVGCTTAGEFSSAFGFSEDSLCMMFFSSDRIAMVSGVGKGASLSPAKAARDAVTMAKAKLKGLPSLCLAFPDALTASASEIVAALGAELENCCPVFGGFAGGEELPSNKVFQFWGEEVLTDSVPILLFSGPLRVVHRVSNSWRPVGVRTTIDGVQGNRVTHIGGRSALQFYRDIFGTHSTPLPEMPMAVFEEGEQFYIRTPVDYDESDGSVGFSDTMSKNAQVQLTEATPDGIIDDVDASLGKFVDGLDQNWAPQAAIVASCVSRKWILGTRSAEEFALLDSRLPKALPLIGFYSFGEIGPLGPGRDAVLHNCTMITLLLGEADAQRTDHPTIERKAAPARLVFRSQQHIELLERKLNRARQSQARLEYQKALNSRMLTRLNGELVEANRRIDEQNSILRDSLSLAQQVQQRLLPQVSPIIAGFDIAGRSIYCDETGGDYFDYLVLPEDHGVSVVVGDVSGHGIASALLMATARALLRMRASKSGRPCEFVTDLNRLLTSDVYDSGQFMTLFFLRLEDGGERLTWVRAGHDPALIYNAAADSFEELHGQGIAMGIRGSEYYTEYTRRSLSDNELLVIGTDGIWEALDPENRFFGKERFKDIIRRYSGCTARQMLDYVLDSVQRFCRGRPFADDATLVVIQNKNNRRSSRCPNP